MENVITNNERQLLLDKVGMSASMLCAVHCALAPVLLPLATALGLGVIWSPVFENGMIFIALAVGLFALTRGYRNFHKKLLPIYFLVLGISAIVASKFLVNHEYEGIVLPLGVPIIVAAHWLNLRLCKSCKVCQQAVNVN